MSDDIKSVIEEGLKKVNAVQGELKTAIDAHTSDIEKHGKSTTELTGKIDSLSDQYKSLKEQLIDLAQKQNPATLEKPSTSAGAEFIKSDAYKSIVDGTTQRARIELKNTVVTGPGMPFPIQREGVIPGLFTPLTIASQLPTITVSSNAVNSLRENVWTNGAAEVAE